MKGYKLGSAMKDTIQVDLRSLRDFVLMYTCSVRFEWVVCLATATIIGTKSLLGVSITYDS
jgi:hypothetical protein